MEGKNIPPMITLTAALISSLFCIGKKASLYTTLKIVLLVMIIFYIIGCIARKIIVKINNDAEEAALQKQKEEQEKAAKELEEAELQKEAEQKEAEQKEAEQNEQTAEENQTKSDS